MLSTPLEQLAYIVEKAREFDAMTDASGDESGSNASDDGEVAILEDTADNPTRQELEGALQALDDTQRIELLALMWLGRGDYDASEWSGALDQAREVHDEHEIDYLIGTPLLADYLEEAIAALGYSLADYGMGRL